MPIGLATFNLSLNNLDIFIHLNFIITFYYFDQLYIYTIYKAL